MPLADRPRSLRSLWLFSVLTLAGLAGLVADLLALGPIYQAALPPTHERHTVPNTDLNPFGVNIFLDNEVEEWKKRRTMEMIADAGIGWVKQEFSWAEIEPRQGYFWDVSYGKSSWEKFDEIVDLAEEYGLEVIARIDRPPAWARAADSNPEAPPTDPHTYANFIYEFVTHYRGRIHYIQIWNEPNLDNEWVRNEPVDARSYVTMLRLAYEQARKADPNIRVLSAPLAARTTDDPNRLKVSDLTYLDEMYRAGAAPYFDILSANGYGFEDSPEAPPDPARLNFRRVELVRMIMEKYGDQGKAIWLNEYGWNAAPADLPAAELMWGRVSEEQQAQWTVQGIAYAREHWPWAGVICIWYFRHAWDLSPPAVSSYFRMVNVDFTPLPVYTAVQEAAPALAIATPGWFEETAAPVHRQGRWQLLYDSASGEAYMVSSEPGSRMVLTFLGTDLSLRVRRGPDGGRFLVTVDGVSGQGTTLPHDSFGQAYLDLYSPGEEWVDVPVVQGLQRELPPRLHRLELTLSDEKSPDSQGHTGALSAFAVDYRRSYTLFWAIAGFLAAGTAAALAALARELCRPSTPRLRRVPANPWTLRPEQLLRVEDETAPPSSPEAGDTLPPTEEP